MRSIISFEIIEIEYYEMKIHRCFYEKLSTIDRLDLLVLASMSLCIFYQAKLQIFITFLYKFPFVSKIGIVPSFVGQFRVKTITRAFGYDRKRESMIHVGA